MFIRYQAIPKKRKKANSISKGNRLTTRPKITNAFGRYLDSIDASPTANPKIAKVKNNPSKKFMNGGYFGDPSLAGTINTTTTIVITKPKIDKQPKVEPIQGNRRAARSADVLVF